MTISKYRSFAFSIPISFLTTICFGSMPLTDNIVFGSTCLELGKISISDPRLESVNSLRIDLERASVRIEAPSGHGVGTGTWIDTDKLLTADHNLAHCLEKNPDVPSSMKNLVLKYAIRLKNNDPICPLIVNGKVVNAEILVFNKSRLSPSLPVFGTDKESQQWFQEMEAGNGLAKDYAILRMPKEYHVARSDCFKLSSQALQKNEKLVAITFDQKRHCLFLGTEARDMLIQYHFQTPWIGRLRNISRLEFSNMPVQGGSSGAALVSERGEIAGVVSVGWGYGGREGFAQAIASKFILSDLADLSISHQNHFCSGGSK